MQKLMAIFAHPDDEGAMGGTLAKYAAQDNTEVMLVCGTRGEVGEISDPALATPETLGEVRQQELECASKQLGIQHLAWLDYRDSGMAGTPPNEDPRALVNADSAEIKGRMRALIEQFQPDIVVTFEPFGWYGHPDHIATGKWATELFLEMDEAIRPKKLYHSVIKFSGWRKMIEAAIEGGYLKPDDGPSLEIPEDKLAAAEASVTHSIAIDAYFEHAQASQQCHKTQFGEDSMWNKIPEDLMRARNTHNHFAQIWPEPDAGLRESNSAELFD